VYIYARACVYMMYICIYKYVLRMDRYSVCVCALTFVRACDLFVAVAVAVYARTQAYTSAYM
jgi:hypothetical protein